MLYKAPSNRQNITYPQAQQALELLKLLGITPKQVCVFNPNGWAQQVTPLENIPIDVRNTEPAHWCAIFPPAEDQGRQFTWRALADVYREIEMGKNTNLDPKYVLEIVWSRYQTLREDAAPFQWVLLEAFEEEIEKMLRERIYGARELQVRGEARE